MTLNPLCAIQISGKPAARGGTRGRSVENFAHPLGYHSLDSPGVKSDNPRGGILEKLGVQGWLITSMRRLYVNP